MKITQIKTNADRNQASRDIGDMLQKKSKKFLLEENQVRRNISVCVVTKTYLNLIYLIIS